MKQLLVILIILLSTILVITENTYAGSFSSPNVPIDDPVYRDIDKLAAFGLVKDAIYGQRPWSRDEIARLIGEAIRHRGEIGPPLAPDDREISARLMMDDLLGKLKGTYREELIDQGIIEGHSPTIRVHPLRYVEAQYTFLDSEARPISDNGLGTVTASIEPLDAYDEGRRYPDGHQFSLETEHSLRATRYFSFYARPRFQVDITNGSDADARPFVQQLYGKFVIKNVELEIGRDSVEWGQGAFGGILLSNNARPFDLIKLSNPSPTILPWVFKYLGPMRYTFFVANLGPEREFPDSFLTGLKLSFKPVSFFEMGFSELLVMGGDGAPPVSIGRIFNDLFTLQTGTEIVNPENKEAGFDFRLFLPMLRNTQLYWDNQFEDGTDGSKKYLFAHLASYQIGIYVPRLTNAGDMDLRIEYLHGSPYFYRHSLFSTGMALNQRLWGDELGPGANGIYVALSNDISQRLRLQSAFRFENRNGDTLTDVHDPSRRVFSTIERPAEKRFALTMKGTYSFDRRWKLTMDLGYERINTFNFVSGDNRNGFLGRVGFRFELF